jgi:hypothetical protein
MAFTPQHLFPHGASVFSSNRYTPFGLSPSSAPPPGARQTFIPPLRDPTPGIRGYQERSHAASMVLGTGWRPYG